VPSFARCARASKLALHKKLAGRMGEIGPAKLAFVERSRDRVGDDGARLPNERWLRARVHPNRRGREFILIDIRASERTPEPLRQIVGV
jgi:hypothetical protein